MDADTFNSSSGLQGFYLKLLSTFVSPCSPARNTESPVLAAMSPAILSHKACYLVNSSGKAHEKNIWGTFMFITVYLRYLDFNVNLTR